ECLCRAFAGSLAPSALRALLLASAPRLVLLNIVGREAVNRRAAEIPHERLARGLITLMSIRVRGVFLFGPSEKVFHCLSECRNVRRLLRLFDSHFALCELSAIRSLNVCRISLVAHAG